MQDVFSEIVKEQTETCILVVQNNHGPLRFQL